ncbi:MAG: hypothetical protein M3Y85_00330 [Bacteroidota bacterium]|nr:hypothetical protein [Bacteroidota bacterium]
MQKRNLLSCLIFIMLAGSGMPLQGCSKYTVTTSEKDPADIYYKQKIAASYFWGIVNKPHRVVDTTCGTAALDEVRITTNIGYSLLHVVTLGIVNIVKVEWKCHKPAPVVGFQP